MTNAEKFKEVFGIDLPIQVFCTHELTEDCRRCLEITGCEAWLKAEYKDPRKSICDSCGNALNCAMQSGIHRERCGFYISRLLKEDCYARQGSTGRKNDKRNSTALYEIIQ